MSKQMTLGITRSLSSRYIEIKRNINNNQYKKMSLNDSGNLINDNGKIKLINKAANEGLELSNWHLPPKYVEIYDSTNDILKEIQIKYARLQEDQQRRIMPKFDDNENRKIDNSIQSNINEITNKIRNCEQNIKSMTYERIESKNEENVRNHMKQNLITKLTELTNKLKQNEEEYIKKFKELVGEENYQQNNYSAMDQEINPNSNSLDQMMNQKSNKIDYRNEEINKLVSSLNDLAGLFKDFKTLVFEQGTILDRIDYNIEKADINIGQAHNQLEQANKHMEKNCARNSNLTLIFLIFIFSVLLILKYLK